MTDSPDNKHLKRRIRKRQRPVSPDSNNSILSEAESSDGSWKLSDDEESEEVITSTNRKTRSRVEAEQKAERKAERKVERKAEKKARKKAKRAAKKANKEKEDDDETCIHRFVRGKNKGNLCGKPVFAENLCRLHANKSEIIKDIEERSEEEVEEGELDEYGNITDLIDYGVDDMEKYFLDFLTDHQDEHDCDSIDEKYDCDSIDEKQDEEVEYEEHYDHNNLEVIAELNDLKDNEQHSPPLNPRNRPLQTLILTFGQPERESDSSEEEKEQEVSKTLLQRIKESHLPSPYKEKLIESIPYTEIDIKKYQWFNMLLDIPFGKYTPPPLDLKAVPAEEKEVKTLNYFKTAQDILNSSVHGMENVKEEILNYLAQVLANPSGTPRIIALEGLPGIGKTELVRSGLAKCLGRPFRGFSMGGAKNSEYFVGHDYTYLGSRPGAIVSALTHCGSMDPIFFMDELDKISNSWGTEIEDLLVHITDPVQNHEFYDKYFDDCPVDLSRVMFVFSLNDLKKINPILLDRIYVINVAPPTLSGKVIITQNYLIPGLLNNLKGLERNDLVLADNIISHIITRYTHEEAGVRKLKDCIRTILMKMNTLKLIGNNATQLKLTFALKNFSLPLQITTEVVDLFLKQNESTSVPKYSHMYT